MRAGASPSSAPKKGALVRLPLQVGTSATWCAARAAIALVPGLALIALGIYLLVQPGSSGGELELSLVAAGGLFAAYAIHYLRLVRKTAASDVLVFDDHLRVEGGSRHGTLLYFDTLTTPWSGVDEGTSDRLILWKIPITAFMAIGGEGFDPTSKTPVWRLWVMCGTEKVELAETDRPGEAGSFRAAAATIVALVEGKRHVAKAPQQKTDFAKCASCGASLVPDDARNVRCRYCGQSVPLPERFRKQAAHVKVVQRARARTTRMIEALVEQPGAQSSNLWLAFFAVLMFAAWPIGWGAIARSVLDDGFQWRDIEFLAAPLVAVLGCFLFARGRLADRGAMQLLTLGFGALAPERAGEPPRCRRCFGPLPDVGIGGVAACFYCEAENIVGIDLRPVVDKARAEEKTFDRTLAFRRRERLKWSGLSAVAVLVLAAWATATVDYIEHPPPPDPPSDEMELGDVW